MLRALKQAGVLWPTVMTLAALPVLVGLGTWQLQRKTWKEGLISRLEARTHAPAVDLADAVSRYAATRDIEYLRVKVYGRLLYDKERYLYATDDRDGPGWQVITPLLTAGQTIVLVNRGFVPEALKDPAKRSAGNPDGEVTVVGLARTSEEPSWFTPKNDVARNIWFWRDIPGLYRSAFDNPVSSVLPFLIEAQAEPANPGGWPKGGVTLVRLPNRHLEYVLTWYGLAVALVAVYAMFVSARLRGEGD